MANESWGLYGYQQSMTGTRVPVDVRIGSHHPPFRLIDGVCKQAWAIRHKFVIVAPDDGTKWPVTTYDTDFETAREAATDLDMWQRAARRGVEPDGGCLAPEVADNHPEMYDGAWLSEDRKRLGERIRTHYPLTRDWENFCGEVRHEYTETVEFYREKMDLPEAISWLVWGKPHPSYTTTEYEVVKDDTVLLEVIGRFLRKEASFADLRAAYESASQR